MWKVITPPRRYTRPTAVRVQIPFRDRTGVTGAQMLLSTLLEHAAVGVQVGSSQRHSLCWCVTYFAWELSSGGMGEAMLLRDFHSYSTARCSASEARVQGSLVNFTSTA